MKQDHYTIPGYHNRPIVADATFKQNNTKKPVILFCHGYKGFKDWGAWNLVAEKFAKSDFFFFKFNFSHNGGTAENPIDFPDLKAFGENNYTIELDDIEAVINWLTEQKMLHAEIDLNNITIVGHSRGGGIITVKAFEDDRIKRIVSWAGVSDFESRFPNGIKHLVWRLRGVGFITNKRTKQKMPHYYQFYKNFKANKKRLSIQNAAKNLNKPHLLIHGTEDETVPYQEALDIQQWNPKAELKTLNQANHSFGAKHPWENNTLPNDLNSAVETTVSFIKAN